MGAKTQQRVPVDEELTWYLMCGESIQDRTSTFREGSPESVGDQCAPRWWYLEPVDRRMPDGERFRQAMHVGASSFSRAGGDRGITDRRFGWGRTEDENGHMRAIGEAEIGRARTLRDRWRGLQPRSRDVLWLVYGTSSAQIAADILAVANLETWQAVERQFGQLAVLGLFIAPDVGAEPDKRRNVYPHHCGPWATVKARQFFALCAARGDSLAKHQAATNAELGVALAEWWGLDAKRVA